ncbi:hypothetical protein CCR75_002541 [Bremia lactucae]|uniref:SAM-dependent MTase RsmB/NOP-type domain-containing protein n=1 Tax=Bremia lactucae TaxID=4779 RepID=A0A976IEU9_BRELC|nr:hypothetical protein CCR75_002541 [Bremia lactucae]
MSTKSKSSLGLYKQSFREYLRETNAVKDEIELDQLMKLLHEPLPVSFRLTLHRPDALGLSELLATKLQFPRDTCFYKDIPVNPPKPIAWYPMDKVAWQMDCGRVALSKSASKHEDIRIFHSWLLTQTDRGYIDRQEAVSMLPVLYLDVQRGHRVLDMCASPGSKTTQILDILLSNMDDSSREEQRGMVVANDADKKRAYMLVHRLTRNTLRRAVVTCGDGDTFPGLYDPETKTLRRTNVFDRVLCDVPCSGDGTLRKSQTLWKEWHIGQGLTLHPIQLALALRGAALLRLGGIMVYSTCSFNPIENEAIAAEVLRRAGGSLKLLDVSTKVPGLIARPGRTNWRVGWRSKSKSTHNGHVFKHDNANDQSDEVKELHEWYDTYDALPQNLRGSRVTRSMFPPKGAVINEIQKSFRLIPIDQNSGGFFIAVFLKVADLPGAMGQQEGLAPLEEVPMAPPTDYICKLCGQSGHFLKNCQKYTPDTEFYSCNTEKLDKEKNSISIKKRETLYRVVNDDTWQQLRGFYGFEDDMWKNRLWCRSDTAATINYVDQEISDACLSGNALDIVNTGLKVFTKITERGKVFYRPSEDSLGFIANFFTKRCLDVSIADFSSLFENADHHVAFNTLSIELQEALNGMPMGPAVGRVQAHERLRMNLWVGQGSLLPRISKAMRSEVHDMLQHCLEKTIGSR